ncbi:MAG: preprotein translocase subunit SecA, partial [Planctomycetes bacterium]|nr:preprotein translocase subunit SecA [Planctomycetota bacterium]
MSERQGILKSLARTLSSAVPGRNRRVLGRMSDTVAQINALEARYKNYTDAQLRGETARFRELLRSGRTLDDLVPEAFAVVREASRRTTRLRHFDVQLMGGIALHQGKIAEMATGEGKTLVATLPAYLNALTGKGVHIVTVNDYLARRDRQWMGPIYEMLGLKVGVIQTLMPRPQRQTAYRADITYGTNKEFGFDFLRDNLKVNKQDLLQQGNYVQYLLHGDKIPPEHRCQRELNYAIVDEVDSVLIDEARTPLIISGGGERAPMAHLRADQLIRVLKLDVHFKIKEKERDLELTRVGQAEVERLV